MTSIDARLDTPRYTEYNLSIQRALPGRMSLELSYAGSKGTHLQGGLNYNQDEVPGPGDVQARRPYPNYGDFNTVSNRANSKYYSGQANSKNRLAMAFTYLTPSRGAKRTTIKMRGAQGLKTVTTLPRTRD